MKKTLLTLFVFVFSAGVAGAHCDSLDGPVVVAARSALESGKPDGVLAWVQAGDEAAIKESFRKTLEVRKLGGAAAELADTWFFETLVRVHRAGEGAPYTGLKPAGSAEEIVKELDSAIEKGDIKELAAKIAGHAEHSMHGKFEKVMELKKTAGQSVGRGREYVAAYVTFMHYAEGVKNAVHGAGHHAAEAAVEPSAHKH